jgi:uncharacterized protein YkwD
LRARTGGPRWALGLTLSAILTVGVLFAPAAEAGSGYRAKLLRMVNATRNRHDLHRLRVDRSLTRDALRHTRRMIDKNSVYDPRNLTRILEDEPWENVGASVVGCADTLRGLHRAFMRHAAHRDILLNPQLRRIGIGVVKVDASNACGRHWFWTTELFYG